MDTSEFTRKMFGPGLDVLSTQQSSEVKFHIGASPTCSLDELLVGELKRKVMVRISGLNDRQRIAIAGDPLMKEAEHSAIIEGAYTFSMSNKKPEDLFDRIGEIVAV